MSRYRPPSPHRPSRSPSFSPPPRSPPLSRPRSPFSMSTNAPSDSSQGLPPLLAVWEDHSVYGIVHPSGCRDICDRYMAHVAEASYSTSQPSFQIALSDRNHKRDVAFFEGVTEGRRRQRTESEHLIDDLERCRAERKEAFETLGRYRIERNEAREELDFLRGQLSASKAECERLTQRVAELSWGKLNQQSPVVQASSAKPESVTATVEDATQVAQPVRVHSPAPISPAIPPSYAAAASARLREQYLLTQSSTFPPLQATGNTPLTSARQRSSTLPLPPSGPPTQSKLVVFPTTPPTDSSAGGGGSRSGLPKTIRQLQSLMNAAHQPNNIGALKKVKLLCAEAHQTPKEQKTDLQRFLLTNWRNPVGESRALPQPRNNPRLEDPIEDWVAYFTEHQSSWPRGVRRDNLGNPNATDLKASRLIARLRPEIDPSSGSTTARHGFAAHAAKLFSTPGMYQKCLDMSDITVAPELSYIRFPGSLVETTFEDLSRHFATCGVTPSMAAEELEPWAREYQAAATDQYQ